MASNNSSVPQSGEIVNALWMGAEQEQLELIHDDLADVRQEMDMHFGYASDTWDDESIREFEMDTTWLRFDTGF